MVEIQVKDGELFVKSEYDKNIVSFMRSRPKRFWNTVTRQWVIPESDLPLLLQVLVDYEYNVTYNNTNEQNSEILNNIPDWYEFKTNPFQHQIEGVNYGLQHPKYLLADEPGLGKTKQMLDLSQIYKKEHGIKHTLIIACVNSLKYNWQAEVLKHTNDKGYILGTRYRKSGTEYIGSNEDRLEDINSIGKGGPIDDYYYIITNIETLRYSKSIKVPLKTKKNGVQRFKKQTLFPIVEAIQKQIADGNINMIIADESHKCLGKDTLVQTDSGPVSIYNIVKNKCYRVKTLNEDGTVSYVMPVNYFENPISQELIELEFLMEDGSVKKLLCTDDHKILTQNDGYVKAKDITENHIIVELGEDKK